MTNMTKLKGTKNLRLNKTTDVTLDVFSKKRQTENLQEKLIFQYSSSFLR